MIGIILGIAGAVLGVATMIGVICLFAWYRIVAPSEAHLVVTRKGKFVVSSDESVGTRRYYFSIPGWVPFFGRDIRIMDVTIKEITMEQETIEKNQARFNVTSSLKHRIKNVKQAAETFISDTDLKEQLKEIVKSGVRAITVQYDVTVARAKKREIESKIREEIVDDLASWGLELINFQLVEFNDTKDSKIISNISRRSEVEIEARTREQKAEKIKQARVKEAESEEVARQREIAKDRAIGEAEQQKAKKIAEQEKEAQESAYEVIRVKTIEQANIDKEKATVKATQDKQVAIIKATQDKEAEEIMMEQKRLEGKGDRERAEEQAKGEAAPIREAGQAEAEIIKAKGLAEAESKDALQKALNKFTDEAIKALVAEKVVEKDRAVGIETAKALRDADVKVFSGGGESGSQGFELGKMVDAMGVANEGTQNAVLNKMARPNDMGMTALALKSLAEADKPTKKAKSVTQTQPVTQEKPVTDRTKPVKPVTKTKKA